MDLIFHNSTAVFGIEVTADGHEMVISPTLPEHADRVLRALQDSGALNQKDITSEKHVGGNHLPIISVTLRGDDARPQDVVDELVSAELLNQTDAALARNELDKVFKRGGRRY